MFATTYYVNITYSINFCYVNHSICLRVCTTFTIPKIIFLSCRFLAWHGMLREWKMNEWARQHNTEQNDFIFQTFCHIPKIGVANYSRFRRCCCCCRRRCAYELREAFMWLILLLHRQPKIIFPCNIYVTNMRANTVRSNNAWQIQSSVVLLFICCTSGITQMPFTTDDTRQSLEF